MICAHNNVMFVLSVKVHDTQGWHQLFLKQATNRQREFSSPSKTHSTQWPLKEELRRHSRLENANQGRELGAFMHPFKRVLMKKQVRKKSRKGVQRDVSSTKATKAWRLKWLLQNWLWTKNFFPKSPKNFSTSRVSQVHVVEKIDFGESLVFPSSNCSF